MNKDWITCDSCEEEFRVINDNEILVSYCPYCAEEIILDFEELEEDE